MKRSWRVNIDALDLKDWGNGGKHAARLASIGTLLGAQKLGYRLVEVEPGKSGWPRHAHHVNEEMFFIIEGEGTLVVGVECYPLRRGDVVGIPAGPDTPHQMINTSDGLLRYLAVSTMEAPDVVEYPDSDKIGVFVGSAPGGSQRSRQLCKFFRQGDDVEYWEGE